MQKMGNAEMTYERRERMKKNMQNTDIKEKIPVYSWIHKDQLKAMENKNKRKQLINNILYIHIITY